MGKVTMYPNPDFGKVQNRHVVRSRYLADQWVAQNSEVVDAELRKHAEEGAAKASARLESVRDSGDSRIEARKGAVDYHVVLSDMAGDQAASAIEKRHNILNGAFGLQFGGDG